MAATSIGGHWLSQAFLPGQMGLAIIEQPHVQNERSELKKQNTILDQSSFAQLAAGK
jgi:hypothetical protein